jgi:antitoxin MazE
MKTNIVTIGNSQGIRIPKVMLEQSKLHGEVDLEVRGDCIVIQPSRKPREDWNRAFKLMSENDDDTLLDAKLENDFDQEEWQW